MLCVLLTLDGPLEEGLAGLAGGHAIVVTRGHVAAHQTQPLGYSTQHELTLHWALFLAEPGGRGGGVNDSDVPTCSLLAGQFLLFYPPVCRNGAGQPCRVAVQPRRVQPIAVHVALDRRPVAGVGV